MNQNLSIPRAWRELLRAHKVKSILRSNPFALLYKHQLGLLGLTLALCFSASTAAQDAIFGDHFEDPFSNVSSDAEAARFLTQATFGPTRSDISGVRTSGIPVWITNQINTPPTLARPYLENLSVQGVPMGQSQRMDRWFHTAVTSPDQLRQRMAYALSQILVISDRSDSLSGDWAGVAEYWDILARGAFGNYRELLEQVTLSPQMGRYLSHYRNQRANPAANIEPDENYAREIMQLFTIGLVERNNDFSPVLDGLNNPLPTYNQSVVTELAQVFTAYSNPCPTPVGSCNVYSGITTGPSGYAPMVCFPRYHDTTTKVLMAGITLPAGPTCPNSTNAADANNLAACMSYCNSDVEGALDVLFNHPNTGPFIARQLIQRFVSSNPSPQYIERVATVFNDDNSGRAQERGNLDSVIRAILLDTEARFAPASSTAGKLREPLLRLTAIWRAFGAVPGICAGTCIGSAVPANVQELRMGTRSPESAFLQRPLGAPTVFNFYEPDYQQPGPLTVANLYSPEFQIINESTAITTSNELWNRIWSGYSVASSGLDVNFATTLPTTSSYIPPASLDALPDANQALIEEMNMRLMYGSMSGTFSPSTGMKGALIDLAELSLLGFSKRQRALLLMHMISISPEFAEQR